MIGQRGRVRSVAMESEPFEPWAGECELTRKAIRHACIAAANRQTAAGVKSAAPGLLKAAELHSERAAELLGQIAAKVRA